MKLLYARHRLDVRPSDLAAGLVAMTAADHDRAASEVEDLWSWGGTALACYSVRSGFHLLLGALDLPRGSRVLFSAVTHPDMPRLAEHHGLVPVPIDLDPRTLAPRLDLVVAALHRGARVLVVAHLFGGHVDLEPLARLCRRHGVLLVEDCAQSYSGPPDRGDANAHVSMFSFGILKTGTALGGALLNVRDLTLLEAMRARQHTWPLQKRASHLRRLLQTAAFVALTRPLPYTLLDALAPRLGVDFDRLVNSAARAFPAGSTDELVARLEQRPNAPLLRLLERRLRTFDHVRFRARAGAGRRLAELLPDGLHVGGGAFDHSHWLFPILVESPAVIDAVRAAGFDAARKASGVSAISAPAGEPDLEPHFAREIMARLVFVPAYPELPRGSMETLAFVLEGDESLALVTS